MKKTLLSLGTISFLVSASAATIYFSVSDNNSDKTQNQDSLYALHYDTPQGNYPISPTYGPRIPIEIKVDGTDPDNGQLIITEFNPDGTTSEKRINVGNINTSVDTSSRFIPPEKATWLWIFLASMSVAMTFGIGWIVWMHFRRKKALAHQEIYGEEKSFEQLKAEVTLAVQEDVANKLGLKKDKVDNTQLVKDSLPLSKKSNTSETVVTGTTKTVRTNGTTEIKNNKVRIGIVNVPQYDEKMPTSKKSTEIKEVKVAPKTTKAKTSSKSKK